MSELQLIELKDKYAFLPSEYVKIFPSSYRGSEVVSKGNNVITNTGLNIESKLSTEFNFRHLSSSYAQKSYLIDPGILKSESKSATDVITVKCCINGYYVEFNITVKDLATVKYITLDTITTSMLQGDTQTTEVIKNKIIALQPSLEVPLNSHYLDTNIKPSGATTSVLCFGGISFYTGNVSSKIDSNYLPLIKQTYSSSSLEPNPAHLLTYNSTTEKYTLNTVVATCLSLNLLATQISAGYHTNIYGESGIAPITTNLVDAGPTTGFGNMSTSIEMNHCDANMATRGFVGGYKNKIASYNAFSYGAANSIEDFKWLGGLKYQAYINLGSENTLCYSKLKGWTERDVYNSIAIGSNLIAVDDQIVIGKGIYQEFDGQNIKGNIYNTYGNNSTEYSKKPAFIIGNSGSVLEIKDHNIYITGCNYNTQTEVKTFDGSLTICGLSKTATGTTTDENAIKLNKDGKLIRHSLAYSSDTETVSGYTTNFISAITQDSIGQIKATRQAFTISTGDSQGQIKINNQTNVTVKSLNTTGSPTFANVTTTGQTNANSLTVTTTGSFGSLLSANGGLTVATGKATTLNGILTVNSDTILNGLFSVKLSGESANNLQLTKNGTGPHNFTLTNCKLIANNGITATNGIDIPSGNISINGGINAAYNSTSSDYKFIVSTAGTVTAVSYTATSDKRLKENIIEYKPEKSILDLPIYKYDFINGSKNQIGCLAQDLKEICPEIVTENENGYLGIQESKLIYLLIHEVKKLKEKIK